ncbi:hypothetical protein BTA51_03675 [Hahella sp. CCB-MM4]|uniref:substrate-binding periplasmic protein n=1 Tax=Hahella sp. (strain CCB-MM4) TaxID=1926491 RepID=UPI000B9AE785|nr:transporter substrate-binding domain-containing protein [Hahella sp. CCB-MM4]OZG74133.1 hypothetical protein BTA51_03675 [Hahella sp. CCB-MM4]
MFRGKSRSFVAAALIVFAIVLGCPAFSSGKPLVVAGDEEKKGSYLVEITEAAFQRVGYETEFQFVPWSRALNKSIQGKYDVLLAAYYTAERAEKLDYSEPIGSADVMLLKRKDEAITFHDLNDLRPYKIGHIGASKVSQEFDEAEKSYLQMEYVYNAETNIRKLLAHRIDLVVEKRQRVDELLKTVFKKDAKNLEYLLPPLARNYFHNCVSKLLKDHEQIIRDFNKGLQMIRDDGTKAKILSRHGIYYD